MDLKNINLSNIDIHENIELDSNIYKVSMFSEDVKKLLQLRMFFTNKLNSLNIEKILLEESLSQVQNIFNTSTDKNSIIKASSYFEKWKKELDDISENIVKYTLCIASLEKQSIDLIKEQIPNK